MPTWYPHGRASLILWRANRNRAAATVDAVAATIAGDKYEGIHALVYASLTWIGGMDRRGWCFPLFAWQTFDQKVEDDDGGDPRQWCKCNRLTFLIGGVEMIGSISLTACRGRGNSSIEVQLQDAVAAPCMQRRNSCNRHHRHDAQTPIRPSCNSHQTDVLSQA